jgi:hypothetical protein
MPNPKPDFSDVKSGSSSSAATPGNQEREVTYTVQSGDSLSKIARDKYGDGAKWKAIFEAAPAPPAAAMVTTIETGRHIGADKRISDTASTIAPKDTLYVSVVTTNATPSTQLKSVVTFQGGQVVDSATQVVAAPATTGGTSVTEFHWVKPDGWPVGDYTIEVWLDGQSAGTRTVTIKR